MVYELYFNKDRSNLKMPGVKDTYKLSLKIKKPELKSLERTGK
jgi:hypothetical protein